jgi:hypothetical protein
VFDVPNDALPSTVDPGVPAGFPKGEVFPPNGAEAAPPNVLAAPTSHKQLRSKKAQDRTLYLPPPKDDAAFPKVVGAGEPKVWNAGLLDWKVEVDGSPKPKEGLDCIKRA